VKFPVLARHPDAASFRRHLQSLAPELDCVDEPAGGAGPLARPLEVEGLRLPNRWGIHPMEGWDGTPEGLPTEATFRRWRRFGRSGAGLVWGGEAFAVEASGRANPRQLFLNDAADTAGSLAALREEILAGRREQGLDPEATVVGLQLTHSGRWARPTAAGPAPRTAWTHPVLDRRAGAGPENVLSDDELRRIRDRFVRAAVLAQRAGFDFVDVKACHGYLLHELLGARDRPGPYGGSLEGRTRLFREIVERIRAECPGLTVATRISAVEVVPYRPDPETGEGVPEAWEEHLPWRAGFGVDPEDPRRPDPAEACALLGILRGLGIRLVNVSLGSPYTTPHLQRPAAWPPSDGYLPPEDPLASVALHLRVVRRLKEAAPETVLVGSGYTYLQEWLPHVAEYEAGAGHVDLVGLGRMVLSYPELPLDHLAGRPLDRRRLCRTFSDCTTAPRNGLRSGCYPLDPYYRKRPEAGQVRSLRRRPV